MVNVSNRAQDIAKNVSNKMGKMFANNVTTPSKGKCSPYIRASVYYVLIIVPFVKC